jgi:hypothetical protein
MMLYDVASRKWLRASSSAAFDIAAAAAAVHKSLAASGSEGSASEGTSTTSIRLPSVPQTKVASDGGSSGLAHEAAGLQWRVPMSPASEPHDQPRSHHGWPGVLFYWLCYLGAVVYVVLALVIAALVEREGGAGAAFVALVGLLGLAGASALLGYGVQRQRRWAWYVALVVSYLTVLGALASILIEPDAAKVVGGLVIGALYVLYIVYFHRHRHLFSGTETRGDGYSGLTGG